MPKIDVASVVCPSTVDWRGRVSMTLFMRGCPLRCPCCCNYDLREPVGKTTSITTITDGIMRNREVFDALVAGGAEPFMQPGGVKSLSEAARRFGLDFGVHTSGIFSARLLRSIEAGQLDGIMIDVKAPLNLHAYRQAIGYRLVDKEETSGRTTHHRVKESLAFAEHARMKGKLQYFEARTTLFPGVVDSVRQIEAIAQTVPECDAYVLQQGRPDLSSDPVIRSLQPVSESKMIELGYVAEKYGHTVLLRTASGIRKL